MAIITIEYEKGDKVKVPFDETGTIVRIEQLPWMKKYWVKIRKSNGFNKTNQIIDFFERDLELEKNNYIYKQFKTKNYDTICNYNVSPFIRNILSNNHGSFLRSIRIRKS